MRRALIIIDMQKGLHTPEKPLFHLAAILAGINQRIAIYRQAGEPVIFIQHHDEDLPAHSLQWQLMDELDVQSEDIIIAKTHANSFYQTTLAGVLQKLKVSDIELCGAQTEYCVDTTIRIAHGLGYGVVMQQGLHTTVDSNLLSAEVIRRHHETLWGGRFLTWI
ncbi:cysteine hydrolase [Superficieibacter electus]|uniref:Cysteine hydrolase n=1 Tax=Superficieibacter electus TaxID=2022662 RepID=A0A2P5GRM6_9ENTR|nr:cysteine hydrolase family protein [Superficieibacter electus]POP45908.1 cysteine hydrolase [Superficieibacter electus]POP49215.1 cysteine hydrolase [Superficieibacter electus]